MLEIKDLGGIWRRSLLVRADGSRDTTTEVHWLQGPSLYGDLRQPERRPSFENVKCLRDLRRIHMAWLARQEGFAGHLTQAGGVFEWHRALDYQPPSALADAGRLWMEDGIMKEEGRDSPYLEHWHRPEGPCAGTALVLEEAETGRLGLCVQAGPHFIHARARAVPLVFGGDLSEQVAAVESLEKAQDILDCEISFGAVEGGACRILRSTLPFREGACLHPQRQGAEVLMQDIDPCGRPLVRRWNVRMAEDATGGGNADAP